MARFLTLHGFDSELSDSLAHTPEAPDAVRASSVHSLHRNERLLSQMKRSQSQNRERCVAYVRRSARVAATRFARHCDRCLSEALEISEQQQQQQQPLDSVDSLGRPLVTDLLDNLRALPEHAARMAAVLDRDVQAAAARHRAASRALAGRLDGVRSGVAKQELHAWWTTLIKESTLAHMRAVGVDLAAVGDDYTTRPPADLGLVRRNCDILAALLDADSDAHNTKALLDSLCNTVYPRVNQFIDDALVAVAIACAVAPSVYERQYDASALLTALRTQLADALAAEATAAADNNLVATVVSGDDDDSDLDTASDSPHESIRASGNFLARRSMSSISGGLCLSDSDRSVLSIANAFGFGSSSGSVGAAGLQWCETTLDDVAYLITMKQLERAGVAAERLGPVPVSGLVVGRITRCLQEHRTVLELFGDGRRQRARAQHVGAQRARQRLALSAAPHRHRRRLAVAALAALLVLAQQSCQHRAARRRRNENRSRSAPTTTIRSARRTAAATRSRPTTSARAARPTTSATSASQSIIRAISATVTAKAAVARTVTPAPCSCVIVASRVSGTVLAACSPTSLLSTTTTMMMMMMTIVTASCQSCANRRPSRASCAASRRPCRRRCRRRPRPPPSRAGRRRTARVDASWRPTRSSTPATCTLIIITRAHASSARRQPQRRWPRSACIASTNRLAIRAREGLFVVNIF
jgi:hypothetical protein